MNSGSLMTMKWSDRQNRRKLSSLQTNEIIDTGR
jgi:hypothetical protein